MKKLFVGILMVMCMSLLAISGTALADNVQYNGKGDGIGILYSSEEIITMSIDFNGWIIGIFGKNWSSAETRDANTSNYGRTKIGEVDGETYGLDVGYSWKVHKYIRLGIEGSVAYQTDYDKYRDYRFTENYYLVETDSETLVGAGVMLGVPIHPQIELIVSANSIKGIGGGIMFRW